MSSLAKKMCAICKHDAVTCHEAKFLLEESVTNNNSNSNNRWEIHWNAFFSVIAWNKMNTQRINLFIGMTIFLRYQHSTALNRWFIVHACATVNLPLLDSTPKKLGSVEKCLLHFECEKSELTYRNTIKGPIQITSHAAIAPSMHCVRCSRDASVCASYKSYERRL